MASDSGFVGYVLLFCSSFILATLMLFSCAVDHRQEHEVNPIAQAVLLPKSTLFEQAKQRRASVQSPKKLVVRDIPHLTLRYDGKIMGEFLAPSLRATLKNNNSHGHGGGLSEGGHRGKGDSKRSHKHGTVYAGSAVAQGIKIKGKKSGSATMEIYSWLKSLGISKFSQVIALDTNQRPFDITGFPHRLWALKVSKSGGISLAIAMERGGKNRQKNGKGKKRKYKPLVHHLATIDVYTTHKRDLPVPTYQQPFDSGVAMTNSMTNSTTDSQSIGNGNTLHKREQRSGGGQGGGRGRNKETVGSRQ